MTTTPEPAVSPAPDTDALRNQLARAISEQWLDDESERGRTDYYSLTDAVLPIIAEREAGLRADLNRARADVDRLTAELLMVPRANDSVIAQVVEAVLAAGDWNGGIDAARKVFRERAAVACVSGARPIPDDAAERIHAVVEELCTGQDDANGGTVYFLDHHEGPQELAREVLKALGATPTTGPDVTSPKADAKAGPAAAAADVTHGTRVLVYPGENRENPGMGRNHGVGRITWMSKNVDLAKSEYGVSMDEPYSGTSVVRTGDFEVLPPAAPQAPAQPTSSAKLFNRLISGASVVNGVPQTPVAREDTAPPAWSGHKVFVGTGADDKYYVNCLSGCGHLGPFDSRETADDIRDQHAADTLRPAPAVDGDTPSGVSQEGGKP